MAGYAGKIKNTGTNMVKAPFGSGASGKGTTRITGNDLRVGNRGGKKSK